MLIDTVIALSDFFINNFPDYSWYPHWYLGTPFRFLIGPIVPNVLLIVNLMSPFSTLANSLFVIFIYQFMVCVGVYKLV